MYDTLGGVGAGILSVPIMLMKGYCLLLAFFIETMCHGTQANRVIVNIYKVRGFLRKYNCKHFKIRALIIIMTLENSIARFNDQE